MTTPHNSEQLLTSSLMQRIIKAGSLLLLLSLVFSQVGVTAKSFRMKRSGDKTCLDSVTICKLNTTCWSAYKMVKKKCTITSARCSAASKDVAKCANNIDTLRETAFSMEDQCSCWRYTSDRNKKLQKCIDIYNSVYFNPCFERGLAIRNRALQSTSDTWQSTVAMETDSAMMTTKYLTRAPVYLTNVAEVLTTDVIGEKEIIQSARDMSHSKISESDLQEIDSLFSHRDDIPHIPVKPESEIVTENDVTKVVTKSMEKMSTSSIVLNYDNITTKQACNNNHTGSTISASEIVLITLGSVAFLCVILGIICYYRSCRKRRSVYSAGKRMKNTSFLASFHSDKTSKSADVS